jgi:hypothetical protein
MSSSECLCPKDVWEMIGIESRSFISIKVCRGQKLWFLRLIYNYFMNNCECIWLVEQRL